MIIAPDWLWVHFPKCAGTSVEAALKALFRRNRTIRFDPLNPDDVIWHHSVAQRRAHDPAFDVGGRRVISNIRRLPDWLLSRVHFEVQRRGPTMAVDRADLLKGRFAIAAGSGTRRLHSADEVLAEFLPEVTHWVRMEHLAEDLAPAIGRTAQDVAARMPRENVGKMSYIRHIPFWFTGADLRQLYAANPLWEAVERKVYGKVWGE